MITIFKNNINECAFTLMEKTTLTDANYIMEFYSKDTHQSKLLWLYTSGDTSNNTMRYNLFEITEAYTDDVNNLQINLDVSEYDYRIYQTTGTTLSVIGLPNSMVVESGRCNVRNPNASYNIPTFTGTPTEFTFE